MVERFAVSVNGSVLFWIEGKAFCERMESHDYEHYRNLTLMFFFEKLLEKGGESRLIWK